MAVAASEINLLPGGAAQPGALVHAMAPAMSRRHQGGRKWLDGGRGAEEIRPGWRATIFRARLSALVVARLGCSAFTRPLAAWKAGLAQRSLSGLALGAPRVNGGRVSRRC